MAAIAPIRGALRRSALTHITLGISCGLAGGFAFWYGHHVPKVGARDAWYMEQEQKKAQA
ncbi:hypothetical protein BMF94_5137 [Rhodotorula taiwanensis]|uniref:Cytochrome c oxidase polypeptide VIIA n=1 Tax=Rhodotorula taiwanensis TaxID=741276 RepID=A0A2S5B4U2_9BASI|nr:hypothetical protein BMF94_5137 [Rhodotorula taiwanensis]